MGATLRRVIHVLLLATMLGAVASLAGVTAAGASVRVPAAGSATPPVPTSTITPDSVPTTVTYCVDNYLGNSTVSVANNANGAQGTIQTDSAGHGCTHMPVKTDCSQPVSNTIVASGLDQAKKPATSQATYTTQAACPTSTPTPTPTATATATSTSTSTSTSNPSPSPTDTTCDPSQADLSIVVTQQGGVITGTACGFLPGESVDLFVHSQPTYLGTTAARSDGTVKDTVTLPMSVKPGSHTWIYVGRTSGNQATAEFRVTKTVTGNGGGVIPGSGGPGSGNNPGTASGTGGNGLAFTGANVAALIVAALMLLGVGTMLVVTVRRRRAVAV